MKNLKNHALEFNFGPTEVDKQANFDAGCFQFIQQLGLIIGVVGLSYF
jgi:hypothetical protein